MKIVFDNNDYRPLADGENYEKKFVILDTSQFLPEYANAKNQLFYAECGFGCYPEKMGGKIFGKLWDERYQTRREYVLGVATEKAIEDWEVTYNMKRDIFIKER